MKRLLGLTAALALSAGAAHAQLTSIPAKDANGVVQNLCVYKTGGVSAYCQNLFVWYGGAPIAWAGDSAGRAYVNVYNLPVDTNGYLKSGVYDSVNGAAVNLISGTAGVPLGGVVSVQSPGAGMVPFDISLYASSQTAITASSGNEANTNAVATLAGAGGKTTYISGFRCTGAGSTSGLAVNLTVAGVVTGTMTFTFVFPAGALVGAQPVAADFRPPLPASSTNTPIVVTLPAGGSGNTNASCSAWGVQQ